MSLPGIGVFGTDTSTHIIVPLLRKEGFRVEAIWGRTNEEAAATAFSLDIPFATNRIDDVLLRKDVDLILILCSPLHHSQIAAKALGIGKHVSVQPPAALGQNETLRMVQAAQYYPALLSVVNYSLRFVPAIVKMKQLIQDGYVGTNGPTFIDIRLQSESLVGFDNDCSFSWVCDHHNGGGVLNVFGSHLIDLLQFITDGKGIERVHGVVRTFCRHTSAIEGIRQITSDDMSSFQLELSGGILANVVLNSQMVGFNQEVVVSGCEGQLIVRNGDLYGRKIGMHKEDILHLDTQELTDKTLAHPHLPNLYLKGWHQALRHLADRFRGISSTSRVTELASFEDALRVEAVIEAIRKSSLEKKWMKVNVQTQPDLLLLDKSQLFLAVS